jgi:hypothetical protein
VGADGALGFDGQRTDDKKFQMTSDLVGMGDRLRRQELTGSIIGAFFDVYNALGYGLLESVYAAGLAVELSSRGHVVEWEGNRRPAALHIPPTAGVPDGNALGDRTDSSLRPPSPILPNGLHQSPFKPERFIRVDLRASAEIRDRAVSPFAVPSFCYRLNDCSIAGAVSFAISAYPAAFGCTPSALSSGLMPPCPSSMAECRSR